MIHQTAVIGSGAKIGANVEIGPHSVIGGAVIIGDDCVIGANVVIEGEVSSAEAIELGTANHRRRTARRWFFAGHAKSGGNRRTQYHS